MTILNRTTDHELDQVKRHGWTERRREPRPREGRILITLWHPRPTIGEGHNRHQTPSRPSAASRSTRPRS
jgi:hypothetical protein